MTSYLFGDLELDLDARQLRLRGEPVHLERRPYDLLVLLVKQHGRMVAREEIITALWPNNVIIDFDAGLNTLVRKVRNALQDSSENPKFIETVPGRGYRFIAAVTSPATLALAIDQPVSRKTSRLPLVALIATAVLLLVTVGFVFLQSNPVDSVPTRIAVLPFENMTGNDEFRYLASGLAEETSMALARIDLPNLSVIGGGSAKALADTVIPLQDFGRRFGVNFVVLSSLRVDQSRIRVTSRLLRVADGEQIWSASFDRELTNVLGLQRELSIAIAEQIRQRLSPEVAAVIDRRQTQNPKAYELYLKGRYAWTQFLPDSMPRALGYYQQAVATDPNYGLAWAGISHALTTSIVTTEANRDAILPASRDALRHALEYSPDLAETKLALASFYFFLNLDLPRAEQAAR
ncbi:MAG: winged helix-turn-helix domain-containing protein, partial [Woeseia sp.]